jgi:branched-chain amino acid aminotransferase
MHRLILHNDAIRDASDKLTSPGQVGLMNGWGVFSTLRIADGVPFAFERHWARMRKDAQLMHVPFPDDAEAFRSRLLELIEANGAFNSTLRVAVVRNHGGPFEGPSVDRPYDVIAFTTALTDWPASVALAMKADARHAKSEFAGTKILSWSFNLTWNEQAHQRGFDEAVLLNERGEVSECTSANLFAIEGSHVWTPPLSAGCLPGVTRAILLQEIRVPGISIAEKTLLPADLERADRVFITSSTRDLLPVREIETLRVRTEGESVLHGLQQAFITNRNNYVAEKASVVIHLNQH